jgi:hypothetical protein
VLTRVLYRGRDNGNRKCDVEKRLSYLHVWTNARLRKTEEVVELGPSEVIIEEDKTLSMCSSHLKFVGGSKMQSKESLKGDFWKIIA